MIPASLISYSSAAIDGSRGRLRRGPARTRTRSSVFPRRSPEFFDEGAALSPPCARGQAEASAGQRAPERPRRRLDPEPRVVQEVAGKLEDAALLAARAELPEPFARAERRPVALRHDEVIGIDREE